jgi:hypothetical protein
LSPSSSQAALRRRAGRLFSSAFPSGPRGSCTTGGSSSSAPGRQYLQEDHPDPIGPATARLEQIEAAAEATALSDRAPDKRGSTVDLKLVVEDINTVRTTLAGRGVPVGEVQQLGPGGSPGSRFCFFEDPDGNGWSIQELKRS